MSPPNERDIREQEAFDEARRRRSGTMSGETRFKIVYLHHDDTCDACGARGRHHCKARPVAAPPSRAEGSGELREALVRALETSSVLGPLVDALGWSWPVPTIADAEKCGSIADALLSRAAPVGETREGPPTTLVNALRDPNYTPYCGDGRTCSMPRAHKTGHLTFECPECRFKMDLRPALDRLLRARRAVGAGEGGGGMSSNTRSRQMMAEHRKRQAGRTRADFLRNLREAFADYHRSEGCSCCQDREAHKEAEARIAKLLRVPKYKDGSGWDFAKFRTEGRADG